MNRRDFYKRTQSHDLGKTCGGGGEHWLTCWCDTASRLRSLALGLPEVRLAILQTLFPLTSGDKTPGAAEPRGPRAKRVGHPMLIARLKPGHHIRVHGSKRFLYLD